MTSCSKEEPILEPPIETFIEISGVKSHSYNAEAEFKYIVYLGNYGQYGSYLELTITSDQAESPEIYVGIHKFDTTGYKVGQPISFSDITENSYNIFYVEAFYEAFQYFKVDKEHLDQNWIELSHLDSTNMQGKFEFKLARENEKMRITGTFNANGIAATEP